MGFMGSGKTSLGKQLARRLKYDFLDLDQEIEKAEGCSIQQLFAHKGEQVFRQLETEVLKKISASESSLVVSLGGGTPCFNDNLTLIKTTGTCIYLSVPAPILQHRLANAYTERPLLAGKSETELKEYINQTLKEREVFYLKANYVVESSNTGKDLVERIMNFLPK